MKVRRVKISDIATVLTGGTPSTRNKAYWEDGNIPWLPSGVCQNCIVDHADTYITKEGLENSSAKMLKPDSVLIALTGATAGKVGLLSFEACANQSVTGILPNDFSVPKYLFHCLIARRDKTLQDCYGGAQPHISQGYVKNIEIPLPPLAEQKRIAGELDRICELKKNAEERLALMDQLVKSKFVEMFGDRGKEVLLSDYVWFQEGPGVRSVDFCEAGTVLLTGSNINNNCISFGFKSDRFISKELSQGKYKHFLCDKGDVLAVTSAIEASRFDEKIVSVSVDKEYCLNTGIIRFKPNHNFLTDEYFKEFLKSRYFKNQVMSSMRGIAIMHFGPTHLKKMKILLPESLEDQREFAAFVESVDKSKAALRETIATMETLYKERLQEYFA